MAKDMVVLQKKQFPGKYFAAAYNIIMRVQALWRKGQPSFLRVAAGACTEKSALPQGGRNMALFCLHLNKNCKANRAGATLLELYSSCVIVYSFVAFPYTNTVTAALLGGNSDHGTYVNWEEYTEVPACAQSPAGGSGRKSRVERELCGRSGAGRKIPLDWVI